MKEKFPELTPQLREDMLRLIDGNEAVCRICFMFLQVKLKRVDEVVGWLVKHGITGQTFLSWFEVEHQYSPLSLFTYVTNRIERNDQKRSLFAGRDFY